MKKLITIFICIPFFGYSQFYNKLNDVFLTEKTENSVFSKDLEYFRKWLQTSTIKVFAGNIQTSISTNGNAVFYGLDLIPRGNYSNKIFETGITFNMNGIPEKSIFKIPITFRGLTNINNNSKKASGSIQISSEKIFLEFPKSLLIPMLENFKIEDSTGVLSRFIISDINYEINENTITIDLSGKFNLPIKLKKQRQIFQELTQLQLKFSAKNTIINIVMMDVKKGKTVIPILEQ